MSTDLPGSEVEPTENITPEKIWAILAWVATALILLSNAGEKIVGIVKAIKAPNAAQNSRLDALERDMILVKQYLTNDKNAIDSLAEGDRVTKHAILALLGHGIDGNNVDEMISSKRELETYLINR